MALPPHSYDVFLSFRGEDTRKTFTDHLYTAFINAGFRTFRDDDELERGEDIKPELQRAIQQSRSSVIVFSKNYASSRWCLDELVMILERKRTSDHVVLPVFYDVDPSQVRKPTASLATAFVKNGSLKVKVEKWRAALTEVADLAGMVLQNQADGHESKFIKKIVKVIEGKLSRTAFNVAPHLIGIHSRVRDINLWLHDGSTKVRVLLIYGMRGIGKTTLAKFVYNINFKRYEGSSFLENIKEHSKQTNGLVQIQKKLLSDVLNGKRVKVGNISEGIIKIEDALSSKRVLLVFDDVDHVEQLDAVLRMQSQFCPGSKIIITTSHAALLNASHQAIKVHNLETFNSNESLELFSWHAFGQDHPEKDYMELSERVVNLSGGLPLALKILGSSLSGKSTVVWESALNKLEAIPNGEILNKLRISYDSLQDQHDRSLFLHIACFFIGMEKDVIVRILDSCGFYTIVGIQNLIDRCLVTVDEYNKVHMHYMIHWSLLGSQLLDRGDRVTVSVFTRFEFQVKEYGIQVVYEQEKKMSTREDRIDTSQSNMVLQDDYEAADVISFPIDALFSPSVIAGDFSEPDKVMSGTYFLSNRPEEIVVYRWLWFDDFVRDVEENIGERTDVENLEEKHDGDTKFGDNGSTSRQREGGKAFNFGWNYVVSIFTMTKKIIWKATPDNFRCGRTEGYEMEAPPRKARPIVNRTKLKQGVFI